MEWVRACCTCPSPTPPHYSDASASSGRCGPRLSAIHIVSCRPPSPPTQARLRGTFYGRLPSEGDENGAGGVFGDAQRAEGRVSCGLPCLIIFHLATRWLYQLLRAPQLVFVACFETRVSSFFVLPFRPCLISSKGVVQILTLFCCSPCTNARVRQDGNVDVLGAATDPAIFQGR